MTKVELCMKGQILLRFQLHNVLICCLLRCWSRRDWRNCRKKMKSIRFCHPAKGKLCEVFWNRNEYDPYPWLLLQLSSISITCDYIIVLEQIKVKGGLYVSYKDAIGGAWVDEDWIATMVFFLYEIIKHSLISKTY